MLNTQGKHDEGLQQLQIKQKKNRQRGSESHLAKLKVKRKA